MSRHDTRYIISQKRARSREALNGVRRTRTDRYMTAHGAPTRVPLPKARQKNRRPMYPVHPSNVPINSVTIEIPDGSHVTVKGPDGNVVLVRPDKPSNQGANSAKMSTAAVLSPGTVNSWDTSEITVHIASLGDKIRSEMPARTAISIADGTDSKHLTHKFKKNGIMSFASPSALIHVTTTGQTHRPNSYSFTNINLLDLYQKSEAFKRMIQSGQYIYISGYICLNVPSLFRYQKGILKLKRYVLKNPRKYLIKMVPRHASANQEFQYRLIEPLGKESLFHTKTNSRHIKRYQRSHYGETFGMMLSRLMNERAFSASRLSKETGISLKTIEEYQADKYEDKPELNYITAICIALHLDWYMCDRLIFLAGYDSLQSFGKEGIYRSFLAISSRRDISVKECNALLRSYGLAPLTKI